MLIAHGTRKNTYRYRRRAYRRGPYLAARPAGLGHLPGDIVIGHGNFRLYLPLGTSLLISVLLSLIVWLLGRL